jgi:hypothetical protein
MIIIFVLSLTLSQNLILLLILIIPISYYLLVKFKNDFLKLREKIIGDMMKQVQLQGNENILDLGTGSGTKSTKWTCCRN